MYIYIYVRAVNWSSMGRNYRKIAVAHTVESSYSELTQKLFDDDIDVRAQIRNRGILSQPFDLL